MIVFGWAGKGTLTLKDGQQFRWKPASLLFDREWMFASLADGSAFVSCKKPILRQTGNTNLLSARIEISRSGTSDSLVEILSVLAMYLLG